MQIHFCLNIAIILFRVMLFHLTEANSASAELQALGGGILDEDLGTFLNCDQCGSQCKLKCGTKKFRSCCYRFHRKRRSGVGGVGGGVSRDENSDGLGYVNAIPPDVLLNYYGVLE